jgi:hypothetical protein
MKNSLVPFYGSDGSSLGFRELDAAKRLVAAGIVKPAYGRKGHLKAIFEQQEDGGTPMEDAPPAGGRYSYSRRLDNGRACWHLKKLDGKDEDGVAVCVRPSFVAVVASCVVEVDMDSSARGAT